MTSSRDLWRIWYFRMLTSSLKKVKLNLEEHGIPYYEWESVQMEELAMNLSKMNS